MRLYHQICVGVVTLALVCRSAQTLPTISVRDALQNLTALRGKMVMVRGVLSSTEEGAWLDARECSVKLVSKGYEWPMRISLSVSGSEWLRRYPRLKRDERAFEQAAAIIKAGTHAGRAVTVQATYIGILDSHEDLESHIYRDADGKLRGAGFGHLAASPAQLFAVSIKDVAVE